MSSPFTDPNVLQFPWLVVGNVIPQVIFYERTLGATGTRREIVHTFNQPGFNFMLKTVRVRSVNYDTATAIQYNPIQIEIAHAATGRVLQNAAGNSTDIAIPGPATTWQTGTYPGEVWYNYSDGSKLFEDIFLEELFLPSDGIVFRLSLDTNNTALGTNPVQVMATGILFRGGYR